MYKDLFKNRIDPFIGEYLHYALTCEESDITDIEHKVEEVGETLSQEMSVMVLIWEKELDKREGTFTKCYVRGPSVPPSANVYDTMHVQLMFRDSNAVHACFKSVLDFTSQRCTTDDPQSSQPTNEDERLCERYYEDNFMSDRWEFVDRRIVVDIRLVAEPVS